MINQTRKRKHGTYKSVKIKRRQRTAKYNRTCTNTSKFSIVWY